MLKWLVANKDFHHSGFSSADPEGTGWRVILDSALALDKLLGAALAQMGVMERLLVLYSGAGSSSQGL